MTDHAEQQQQRLRDALDAIFTHLFCLNSVDLDHILGAFPLVFPDDDAGRRRREVLLDEYEEWSERLWSG